MSEYKVPEWLYDNETPFKDLSLDAKAELFKVWVSGETIMYWSVYYGTWDVVQTPTWQKDSVYRVKPKPIVPDSIDWSHVSPEFKYMARDCDGLVYLFTQMPGYNAMTRTWHAGGGATNAKCFASYKQGNVSWKDSIVVRPE